MNELQALIFDVDGTLADTEKDGHRVAFNQAFSKRGLNWNWSVELYSELLAIAGGRERIQYFIARDSPSLPKCDHLSDFITDLHQLKNQYYQALLKKGAVPLRPGVKRLIIEARDRGLRLAIATTSALPNAIALLERNLDPDWFEIVAAGDVVPYKKPAPDIYHYVLAKMNLSANDCIVFEDSQHGLQAATDAGLKTIVTINDYTKKQNFDRAALVVNHLGELDNPTQFIQGKLSNIDYITIDAIQQL